MLLFGRRPLMRGERPPSLGLWVAGSLLVPLGCTVGLVAPPHRASWPVAPAVMLLGLGLIDRAYRRPRARS
ncbi:hypothetical protein KCH_75950 [Kitasatospora cheerisanensis KCTC 2395]|uniref:Uncharacterized protein n=1 Tax=Kitasatospora cheerisanensis KCTC 2395 TaxID=1348663 RepID=A0A066YHU4_9ACTN|nr:hypothetical protein KCH_75950 [Kitasatospora cheerisanensis KCTC 2395]